MSAAHSFSHAPPGPPAHPLWGNLLDLRRDPLGFLTDCARTYGDVVRLRVLRVPVFLLNHPSYIERVLVTQNRNFVKGRAWRASRSVLGEGLVTSEGATWQRQHALVQPAFHRERIAAYAELAVSFAQSEIAIWQNGETRAIEHDMMRLTLRIIAQALVGSDVAENASVVGTAMRTFLQEFRNRVNTGLLIPEWAPTLSNWRMKRATRELEQIIIGLINVRRGMPQSQQNGDLLALLLEARDDDGAPLSDRELRDQVMTMLLAGHETTALTLTMAWYLIARSSDAQAKLDTELQTQLRGRAPTAADVPRLTFTNRVVKETLRLFPPAWAFARRALHDIEIGGYRVPAGSSITLSQWVTHRDPRYYENPEAFHPDRWTDAFASQLPRFAYFPFGGGPRICIGAGFAQLEAVLLLATIAQKVQLTLASTEPLELLPSLTLHSKHPIMMRISKL